jgi:hypothetical protein
VRRVIPIRQAAPIDFILDEVHSMSSQKMLMSLLRGNSLRAVPHFERFGPQGHFQPLFLIFL